MKIMNIIYLAFYTGIIMFSSIAHADTTQPIQTRENQILCIPVFLNHQEKDIIGIDLTIHYESLFLEIDKITLIGGFLEKAYSLTIGNQITDKISLGIYATGGIRKGKGIIATLYFICKESRVDSVEVSIQKFLVNDLSANGTMVWNNNYTRQLDFSVTECSIMDVIQGLQILSGFQSSDGWLDMNGSGLPGMDDVLQLFIQCALPKME